LAKEEDLAQHWREEVVYLRSSSSRHPLIDPMQKLPHVTPLKLTRLRQPFDHPDWIFELSTIASGQSDTSQMMGVGWFHGVKRL
jgi:hypothetical protein